MNPLQGPKRAKIIVENCQGRELRELSKLCICIKNFNYMYFMCIYMYIMKIYMHSICLKKTVS